TDGHRRGNERHPPHRHCGVPDQRPGRRRLTLSARVTEIVTMLTSWVSRRLGPAAPGGDRMAGSCVRRAAGALMPGLIAALTTASCSIVSPSPATPARHPSPMTTRHGRSSPATASTPASSRPPAPVHHTSRPLAGKVVGIDPGHNGRNSADPAFIDHQIFNGRSMQACNTVGTETAGGYTEARINLNVGTYPAADLRAHGARVALRGRNRAG